LFFIFVVVIEPEEIALTFERNLIFTAVPIGIGIYGVRRGRKPVSLRIDVLLMVVFTVITYFIYLPLWAIERVKWVNSLSPSKKLGYWLPVSLLVAYTVLPLFTFVGSLISNAPLIEFAWEFDEIIIPIGGIAIEVIAFTIRSMLNKHFNENLGLGITFSGGLTFFFTFFYLQYKINRLPISGEISVDLTESRQEGHT